MSMASMLARSWAVQRVSYSCSTLSSSSFSYSRRQWLEMAATSSSIAGAMQAKSSSSVSSLRYSAMRAASGEAGSREFQLPTSWKDDETLRLFAAGALKSDGVGGDQGGIGGSGGGGGGDRGGDGGGVPDDARPLHPILAWYMKLLEERPVLTKAVTAAILTFIGDLFTQLVIEKSPSINAKRIVIMTSLGFMLVGPTLHFWYLALSKLVKLGGPKGAGVRLLLDQLVFSPVFIAVFFVSLLVLEGRPSEIGPKLSKDWPSAVVTNWKIWVPFQFVNFLFVPQQLQVAFANVVALAWNAYLSFATHSQVDTDKQH